MDESNIKDCVLTGYARRQERHYGKDAMIHFVLSVGVRSASDPEGETYYAELPLVFTVGKPWDFYDKSQNKSIVRSATAADTQKALDHARKCLPKWSEYVDSLPDNSTMKDAFAWFGSAQSENAECLATLETRTYSVNDGTEKTAHDARLYEFRTSNVISDDFDATFGRSLKAAGFKIGKVKSGNVATLPSPKANVHGPVEPKAPTEPVVSVRKSSKDECWDFYEKHLLKTDPNGEKFYERISEACGKSLSEYKSWTEEDFGKALTAFEEAAGVDPF